MQEFANDAQADMTIRVGTVTVDSEGHRSVVTAPNGTFEIPLSSPPKRGQAREAMSATSATASSSGGFFTPWAIQIALSNPYTYRASTLTAVTGLFIVVGIVAFIVSLAVAAFLARRFTTPLRRLTTAARDLEQGELGSRVPTRLALTGAIEISELSRQFNAMADRLEQSVSIIRRDRDRIGPWQACRTSCGPRSRRPDVERAPQRDGRRRSRHPRRIPRIESSATRAPRPAGPEPARASKLDSGLVLLDLRPDDLQAAVESSIEQAQSTHRRRGVALVLHLPPSPIRIRHDPADRPVVTNPSAMRSSSRRAGAVDVSSIDR